MFLHELKNSHPPLAVPIGKASGEEGAAGQPTTAAATAGCRDFPVGQVCGARGGGVSEDQCNESEDVNVDHVGRLMMLIMLAE